MWACCCTVGQPKRYALEFNKTVFLHFVLSDFVIGLFYLFFSSFYLLSHSFIIYLTSQYHLRFLQTLSNLIQHQNHCKQSLYPYIIISMLLLDIGITIGPLIGYISQLKLIKKTKSLGSFSIDVCAILLISNILRLYFWFTTGYAFNLFIQSILLIIIQLMLLQECVKVQQLEKSMFDVEGFWRWESFEQYVKFLGFFVVSIAVITVFFQVFTFGLYGQMIGYLSMSIEATLGLPQLISNYRTKSVEGLSFMMIGTWFLGDFFKTLYYVMEHQPFQFTMCGVVQLTVDILIILQIIAYSKNLDKIDAKSYDPVNTQTLDSSVRE